MPHEMSIAAPAALLTAEGALPAANMPLDQSRAGEATVTVERADGARLAEIESDWRDLVARTCEPNVFMAPAMLRSAERHCASGGIVSLLAWQRGSDRNKLVGIWAFAVAAPAQSPLPCKVLCAPAVPHGYLGTPVLDEAFATETLGAILDFIAGDRSLPKIIALDPVAADGRAMNALGRVLRARGTAPYAVAVGERPVLQSDLEVKQYFERALSSASRKKLRQHRRRLEEKGALAVMRVDTPDSVVKAFDEFLALEAAGWKGRRGSALACAPADAQFAKDMVAALARRGEAAIYALSLAGKPISMQVVLRSGAIAYTWKTAYDETYADFSPGMLLLEEYTKAFLTDKTIARVDSCAYDTSSFMAAWSERQAIAQVWIDARRGGTLAFVTLSRLQRAYLRLRAAAKDLHRAGRRLWKR